MTATTMATMKTKPTRTMIATILVLSPSPSVPKGFDVVDIFSIETTSSVVEIRGTTVELTVVILLNSTRNKKYLRYRNPSTFKTKCSCLIFLRL